MHHTLPQQHSTLECISRLRCRHKCLRHHDASWRRLVHCAVWRPHIDDVDRLSKGGAAKKRGTGSRDIPHRLNAEERPVYDSAKKKGYLAVRGTGYRRERKGNPLPNIYRQWCDAKATATIVIEQDYAGGLEDVIVVDLASLRLPDAQLELAEQACLRIAHQLGVTRVESRPADAVPFNIITSPLYNQHLPATSQHTASHSIQQPMQGSSTGTSTAVHSVLPATEQQVPADAVQQLEAQVAEVAAKVRHLKEVEGLPNSSEAVKEHVMVLKQLKVQLESARSLAEWRRSARAAALFSEFGTTPPDGAATAEGVALHQVSSMGSQAASDGQAPAAEPVSLPAPGANDPYQQCAIWAIPARALFFKASRELAKAFAKQAAGVLTEQALLAEAAALSI